MYSVSDTPLLIFPVFFLLKLLLWSTIKFAPEIQHCTLLLGQNMIYMKKARNAVWFYVFRSSRPLYSSKPFSVTSLWVYLVFIIIFCGGWWQLKVGWQKRTCKHMLKMITSSRSGKFCIWLKIAKHAFALILLCWAPLGGFFSWL